MPPKFKRNVSEEDLLKAHHSEKEKLLKSDDDDEDFFLNSRTITVQDDKLKQVQIHIGEVSDIMRDNIGKVMDRGQRLEELEDKSDMLCNSADDFRITAKKMKARMWWKNTKMKLIIAGVIVVVILVIIVPIIVNNS